MKSKLNLALAILAGAIVAAALVGTLVHSLSSSRTSATGRSSYLRQGGSGKSLADLSPFSTFRVKLAGKDAPLLVASVALSLPSGDVSLREEIIAKEKPLESAIAAFFATKSAEDLSPSYEGAVKAELRDLVNAQLSLGKVEEILFPQFMIVE